MFLFNLGEYFQNIWNNKTDRIFFISIGLIIIVVLILLIFSSAINRSIAAKNARRAKEISESANDGVIENNDSSKAEEVADESVAEDITEEPVVEENADEQAVEEIAEEQAVEEIAEEPVAEEAEEPNAEEAQAENEFAPTVEVEQISAENICDVEPVAEPEPVKTFEETKAEAVQDLDDLYKFLTGEE